jgi:hypothetical protein
VQDINRHDDIVILQRRLAHGIIEDNIMPNDQAKIAHILQSCLESIQKGEETVDSVLEKYPELADSLRPQLETALWIGSQSHTFDPNPEFIAASRLRLVRRIKYASATAAAQPRVTFWDWLISLPQKRLAFRFALTMLLVLSLLFSTNRLALAASYTIPGDMLYPVKVTHENVRIFFSFTQEGDLALHTDFARQRLVEIEALVLEGRYNFIPATVDGYHKQISLALAALFKLVDRQTQRVEQLASQLYQVMAVESQVLGGIYELAPNEVRSDLIRVRQISQAGIEEMQAMPLTVAYLTPVAPTATDTQPVVIAPAETSVPTRTIEQPTDVVETPEETSDPATAPALLPTSTAVSALQPSATSPPSEPTQPQPSPTPIVTNTPLPPPPQPTITPVCNISGTLLDPGDGVVVVMNVSNNSGVPITITRISIAWPQTSPPIQRLVQVSTDNVIWSGVEITSPTIITSFEGSESYRQIEHNSVQNVNFRFFRNVESSGYQITIEFNTGCSISASK